MVLSLGCPEVSHGDPRDRGSGIVIADIPVIAWPGAEIRPFPVFSLGLYPFSLGLKRFLASGEDDRGANLP
ncbi:hypothetical protein ES703_53559 [subsurface metagenome]